MSSTSSKRDCYESCKCFSVFFYSLSLYNKLIWMNYVLLWKKKQKSNHNSKMSKTVKLLTRNFFNEYWQFNPWLQTFDLKTHILKNKLIDRSVTNVFHRRPHRRLTSNALLVSRNSNKHIWLLAVSGRQRHAVKNAKESGMEVNRKSSKSIA